MEKIKDSHQLLKRLGISDPHDFKKLWELVSARIHHQTTSSELLFIFIEELDYLQEEKKLALDLN
jgi:hypothetical protein